MRSNRIGSDQIRSLVAALTALCSCGGALADRRPQQLLIDKVAGGGHSSLICAQEIRDNNNVCSECSPCGAGRASWAVKLFLRASNRAFRVLRVLYEYEYECDASRCVALRYEARRGDAMRLVTLL